jgi:hypothetical protein
MPAPIPRRKPDQFKSPFAPILAPRANNNRVIDTALGNYLASRAKNDPTGVRLRRFLKKANDVLQVAPRTTTLHFAIRGESTVFWAHEPSLAPSMEVSVNLPTSAAFRSIRYDMM